MAGRSRLLWDISKLLDLGVNVCTVAELREARPDIAAAYPALGKLAVLEEILGKLERGEPFTPLSKPPKDPPPNHRRDLEIERRVSAGETMADVSRCVGISRERVRQIVAKVRSGR
jgi:DNA-binding CsgD family transcriptional regulator